jgi:hypothetical protein
MESAELSGLCPQRLMARVPELTGILPSSAGTEGMGKSLIFTVMKRSIPPDLVEITQLRVSGNSSC